MSKKSIVLQDNKGNSLYPQAYADYKGNVISDTYTKISDVATTHTYGDAIKVYTGDGWNVNITSQSLACRNNIAQFYLMFVPAKGTVLPAYNYNVNPIKFAKIENFKPATNIVIAEFWAENRLKFIVDKEGYISIRNATTTNLSVGEKELELFVSYIY